MNQEERQRQQACSFVEAIGGRIGLYVVAINCLHMSDIHTSGSPRMTIAIVQSLYHCFHLYLPCKDFSYHVGPVHLNPRTVCLLATQDATFTVPYVSTKMHDTLKRPQDTEVPFGAFSCTFDSSNTLESRTGTGSTRPPCD